MKAACPPKSVSARQGAAADEGGMVLQLWLVQQYVSVAASERRPREGEKRRVGELISVHVIPRPHNEVEKIIPKAPKESKGA